VPGRAAYFDRGGQGQVTGVVIGVRCHYCSRARTPAEMVGIGKGGAAMCWRCWESHLQAVQALSGAIPRGCGECAVTFAALQEAAPGGNVRMYVHWKDGIYQLLCPMCSDRYERKRLDLYGDTAYGWKNKLKGAK
jgi:hypothetical protein